LGKSVHLSRSSKKQASGFGLPPTAVIRVKSNEKKKYENEKKMKKNKKWTLEQQSGERSG